MKTLDAIAVLEAKNAEVLSGMRMLAAKLGFLARAAVVTASAIADLHAKESKDLLGELLDAEHGPRRGRRKVKGMRRQKAPKGDANARRTRR